MAGKKVFITGATGGIGYAFAECLHNCGAVIGISGRSLSSLEEVKDKLGKNVYCIPGDLSDLLTCEKIIDYAIETLGGIDVLICNAGITEDKLALRMDYTTWSKVINVNLNSAFLLNRNALKAMLRNKSGKIINVSSVVAFTGNAGQVNYCAAKAGLIGMSKALALEVAHKNITVNCIAPGFIETKMTEKLTSEQKQILLSRIPQNRIGKVEDLIPALYFLLMSDYVTGTVVHVNGGLYM